MAVPDFASPGFMTMVVTPGKAVAQAAWVQTALNSGEGHTPRPPEKGLPGTWVGVVVDPNLAATRQCSSITYAWIPTPEEPPPDTGEGGRTKKHS